MRPRLRQREHSRTPIARSIALEQPNADVPGQQTILGGVLTMGRSPPRKLRAPTAAEPRQSRPTDRRRLRAWRTRSATAEAVELVEAAGSCSPSTTRKPHAAPACRVTRVSRRHPRIGRSGRSRPTAPSCELCGAHGDGLRRAAEASVRHTLEAVGGRGQPEGRRARTLRPPSPACADRRRGKVLGAPAAAGRRAAASAAPARSGGGRRAWPATPRMPGAARPSPFRRLPQRRRRR